MAEFNKKSEEFTRKLFRELCEAAGWKSSEINDEKSPMPDVHKLLNNASKDGLGKPGRPDFFLIKKNNGKIIIVECKGDYKKHKSSYFPNPKASEIKIFCEHNKKEIQEYASDGILWYMSFLKMDFDVIGISISGQKERYEIDTFYWKKGKKEFVDLGINNIRSLNEYTEYIEKMEKQNLAILDFRKVSQKLNTELREYLNLRSEEKPLFVSAILLALKADGVLKKDYNTLNKDGTYKLLDNNVDDDGKKIEELKDITLCNVLIKDILTYLSLNGIKGNKIDALKSQFGFIEGREEFKHINEKLNKNPLRYFVEKIDREVMKYFENNDFDAIGSFYNEFLHYGGGDGSGLGIALTPSHITNLFAELAQLNVNSRVLDICTGTGGFLVASMNKEINAAKCDEKIIDNIKQNNLMGIELQPYMFALAAGNMILRGDGKSNLFYGSCFDATIVDEIKKKQPNIGMINPPYSQGIGLEEWTFVEQMLSLLTQGGTGIAIIPMTCFLEDNFAEIRKSILKNNTLEAVMSMPEQLFTSHGKNNIHTCICVFTAGKAHPEKYKTWFGYWRNDGFEISGGMRIDKNNKWNTIKKSWLDMYISKEEIPMVSALASINIHEIWDWSPEYYLDIDYNKIQDIDFKIKFRNYISDSQLPLSLQEIYSLKHEEIDKTKVSSIKIDWDNTKKFKLSELFEPAIKGTKSIESKVAQDNMNKFLREEFPPSTPICNFISAKNNSNGFCGKFIGEPEFTKNTLTVVTQGDGGKGMTYYQNYPYCCSSMILVLRPKYEKFNEYIGIFISTLIQKHRFKYSFARTVKENDLNELTIKLPYKIINGNIIPDYDLIENYIKSLLV